jgi:hypothetical protein
MPVSLKEILDCSANKIEAELKMGKRKVIIRNDEDLLVASYRNVIDSYLENNIFKLILEPVKGQEIKDKVNGLSINLRISKKEARKRLEKVFFNTRCIIQTFMK